MVLSAVALAFARAGRTKAAKIAMIAITTSSSIKVNALFIATGVLPAYSGQLFGVCVCGAAISYIGICRVFIGRPKNKASVEMILQIIADRNGPPGVCSVVCEVE
jgi:hypothetical protein